jgi:type IV pilus assembly protein PilX
MKNANAIKMQSRQLPAPVNPRLVLSRSQNGASLLISLIFLVILTILGLAALRVATLEERMSGNARDRSLAFQAAEAALRDAELDVQCLKYNKAPATTFRPNVGACISGMTGADAACTDGLCCNQSGLVCIEPSTTTTASVMQKFDASPTPSVAYGTYTGAPALAGVAAQPRYLIEPFFRDSKNYYRITARGFGLGSNTQVTLQEVFKE